MARLRPVGTSWALLAISLALLLNGCSKPEDCIYFSVTFTGIGHLGTVNPDSSIALGVSEDGTLVVGAAADRHGAFNPGTTGVLWADKGQHLTFCPGKMGAGIERLPLCQDANLAEPVFGAAYGAGPLTNDVLGSVTCNGIRVPADWTCSGLTQLPLSFPSGSAIVRARSQVKSPSAAVGFVCPQATAFPEDSAGFAEVWTDNGLTPTKAVDLPLPAGLPSADAFALHASPFGFGGIVAGIGYDAALGRTASSIPAAWSFKKSSLGLAWNGTWEPITLTDETGATARGAALSVTDDVTAIFGHIVKDSLAQACMWPLTGFPSSIPATLLGSPPGITASYVNSAGHNGTVAVGYGLSPSGPKAIGYIGGNPVIIKDEINSLFPGTIPTDWELQEAKAVSTSADDEVSKASLNLLSWAMVGRGTHAGAPEGWVLRFQRVQLSPLLCFVSKIPVPIFKNPHLYKWPPKFPPENPAFRAILDRARAANAGFNERPFGTTGRTRP